MRLFQREMTSITVALCFASAAIVAGCASRNEAPPAGAASGVDRNAAADAEACRKIAYDRVQNIPAVRSGQTSYVLGAGEDFYAACMEDRGHATFPPY